MVDTLRAPSQRMNPSFCSVLSLINAENAPFRFLILDCPTDSRLPDYLEEFQRLNVTDVVVCFTFIFLFSFSIPNYLIMFLC